MAPHCWVDTPASYSEMAEEGAPDVDIFVVTATKLQQKLAIRTLTSVDPVKPYLAYIERHSH